MRRFLLLSITALCSFTISAQVPETNVIVKIKNTHDKPVDNAEVILDFLGSHELQKLGKRRQVHWEVHSNQEGVAHFPPVPQGTIQIQVVAKGYQTFGDKYEIETDSKGIDITLNPPQAQYSSHPPLKPADAPK